MIVDAVPQLTPEDLPSSTPVAGNPNLPRPLAGTIDRIARAIGARGGQCW